jgi:hypothetical protein
MEPRRVPGRWQVSSPEFDVGNLCREMRAARREVTALLRDIPRSKWRTKSAGGWTPAIMASHLVASDRPALIWASSAGGSPVSRLPAPLLNAGNELLNKITGLRSGYTDLLKAADKLEKFEPKLIAATRRLTEDQLSRPAVGATGQPFSSTYELLRYLYVTHFREHAADLRPFADQPDG